MREMLNFSDDLKAFEVTHKIQKYDAKAANKRLLENILRLLEASEFFGSQEIV